MTVRSCSVRAHTRRLPERLDTPKHRQLAAEIGFKPRKLRIRVRAVSRQALLHDSMRAG